MCYLSTPEEINQRFVRQSGLHTMHNFPRYAQLSQHHEDPSVIMVTLWYSWIIPKSTVTACFWVELERARQAYRGFTWCCPERDRAVSRNFYRKFSQC